MKKFFREPIRFIKDSISIESQFEKPYVDSDYNWMHLDWTNPDWEFAWGPHNFVGGNLTPASCTQFNRPPDCKLSVDEDGIISGTLQDTNKKTGHLQNFKLTVSNSDYAIPGEVTAQRKEEEPFEYELVGDVKLTDECIGGVNICVEFESCESFCAQHGYPPKSGCSERTCCAWTPCDACVDIAEMEWTAGESIVRGGVDEDENMPLSFTGGEADFTWTASIVGTGAQGSATLAITGATSSQSNTLNISDDACGIVEISISDSCGNTLIQDIRIIGGDGQWCGIQGAACWALAGSNSCGSRYHINNFTGEISGRYQGQNHWCSTDGDKGCTDLYNCERFYPQSSYLNCQAFTTFVAECAGDGACWPIMGRRYEWKCIAVCDAYPP